MNEPFTNVYILNRWGHEAQYTRPHVLFHSHRITATQRRLSLRRRLECACVCTFVRVYAGAVKSFLARRHLLLAACTPGAPFT